MAIEKAPVTPDAPPGTPTPEVKTVTSSIVDNAESRTFEWVNSSNEKVKLSIRRPTAEEVQASDWEYARVFNEAIAEGIIPRAALMSLLRDRGIDFEHQEKEIDNMQTELNDMIVELEEARKAKDKEKVALKKEDITNLRRTIISKRSALNDYTRNSAESMANDAREVYVLATVLEKDGKPLFQIAGNSDNLRLVMRERLKKFHKGEFSTLRMQASYEFMTFANGLPSNFMDQFPERQKESWE